MDQLSGRTLGLRADTTPQVARIDAHLLNRAGVARLCYCGPVLHTRPDRPHATREPLQFGAEIYGHAGLEADREVLLLALDCLRATQVAPLTVDLADARIVRALFAGVLVDAQVLRDVHAALAAKDATALAQLDPRLPGRVARGTGGPGRPVRRCQGAGRGAPRAAGVGRDRRGAGPARMAGPRPRRGRGELTTWPTCAATPTTAACASASTRRAPPTRWCAAAATTKWGRCSAATGRQWASRWTCASWSAWPPRSRCKAAIRAPWGEQPELRAAIARLRAAGETVVCVLPGHESVVDEFHCDRELAEQAGRWVVRAL